MKSIVPQKTEDLFTTAERLTATEALINLFLQNEENARNEESKTGIFISNDLAVQFRKELIGL